MDGFWGGPSVRPRVFYLGADWTISRLRWSSWSQRRAIGQGYYLGCDGARGPCTKFRAAITVSRVQVHRGTRYFALMKITGTHGQVIYGKRQRVQWLVMDDDCVHTDCGAWTYGRVLKTP